eukprot:366522-Chlamydomonas_euryale.AAC.28
MSFLVWRRSASHSLHHECPQGATSGMLDASSNVSWQTTQLITPEAFSCMHVQQHSSEAVQQYGPEGDARVVMCATC